MLKEKIKSKNILVLGDLMLDTYYSGSVKRISPEAPIPVFLKKSKRSVMGGAANVAANLIAAGQKVQAASVLGKDRNGEKIIENLNQLGCGTTLVFSSENRKTTEKTRLLAQNNQQIIRIDDEHTEALDEKDCNNLISELRKSIESFDAVILSDYLKGVLTEEVCKATIEMANQYNIPVFVDPKDTNVQKYANAYLIKPNKKELENLTGMSVESNAKIQIAAQYLRKQTNCEYVLVTLGSGGMGLFGECVNEFIAGEPREVFDVSGAGDTVIAYLTACCSNKMDELEAAKIANVAAGIKVGKVGTATVALSEIQKCVENRNKKLEKFSARKKIVDLDELLWILHNKVQKKVVFTNGCFDILHAGHVTYLNEASKFGDILIVGVNSDNSVKRLKGKERPINSIEDRITVLEGLESVSYIVVFDEDTPENLIKAIEPDVLVKGADYKEEEVVGAEYVKNHGGEVKLIPLLANRSTTNIIDKSKGVQG